MSVDTSLAGNIPVLSTLDLIVSLDLADTCQVVFLHDPRGHRSGIYNMYQGYLDNKFLYICHDGDLGSMQVIGSSLANIVFCNQTLGVDVHLTLKQVFDDYKNDLWSCVNHNMDYTVLSI